MLKKIAKRINWELEQARDYMEQALLVKNENSQVADLFAMLAEEELVHAEKLLREGHRIIDAVKMTSYDRNEKTEDVNNYKEKCKIIWEWEHRLAVEQISECRYKLSKYKGG